MKTTTLLSEMSDWHHEVCINKQSSELLELQLEKLYRTLLPVEQKQNIFILLEQVKTHSHKLKEIHKSLQELSLLAAKGELKDLKNKNESDYFHNYFGSKVFTEIESFRKAKTKYFSLINTISVPHSRVA